MCGICAVISSTTLSDNEKKIFSELLYVNGLRGFHSTGVFNHKNFIKDKVPCYDFITTKQYENFLSKTDNFIVGHCRHATTGKIDAKTAHPFKSRNVTLVHNGTLFLYDEKKYLSDSHYIAKTIGASDPEEYPEVLSKFYGAYALIWYNSKTKKIYIARNSQRPLHIVKTNITYFISSEKGALEFILGRKGFTKFNDCKIEQIQTNLLYEIDPNNLEIKTKEVKNNNANYYSHNKVEKGIHLVPYKWVKNEFKYYGDDLGKVLCSDYLGNTFVLHSVKKNEWEKLKDKTLIGSVTHSQFQPGVKGSVISYTILKPTKKESFSDTDCVVLADSTVITKEDWNKIYEEKYACCDRVVRDPKETFIYENEPICIDCVHVF